MKSKLLFGTGLAVGYILGSRSGRSAYENITSRATKLWRSEPVQDTVQEASQAVKDKAPEVTEHLGGAIRRAGASLGSGFHRTATEPAIDADVDSDPALNDVLGQDWSDEGGATAAGPATNVDSTRD
ncbi:hypothetical protein [Pseudarthrobacter sp. PS3-L1]|uniref:hypothetical protein n=1 Tax=Pseudarthrobacter sp. PS3-L1 TaxID=3046207 RepID=UPI0024BB8F23|nr:hypothetical protein [Pseudarthrobacter sp. PS3-L1]MDJ0320717.1 hypothetical protein [Pseudarthrobacter sp. PS3-L1]